MCLEAGVVETRAAKHHGLGVSIKRQVSTTIADQIHETREQAQHALDRVYLLCDDLEQLRRDLAAAIEAERYLTRPRPTG